MIGPDHLLPLYQRSKTLLTKINPEFCGLLVHCGIHPVKTIFLCLGWSFTASSKWHVSWYFWLGISLKKPYHFAILWFGLCCKWWDPMIYASVRPGFLSDLTVAILKSMVLRSDKSWCWLPVPRIFKPSVKGKMHKKMMVASEFSLEYISERR